MRATTLLFKALTEETRLRILALLDQGELCVCDLVEVLQLPQSTVSRHLALLKSAGWVADRRQGVWMYYRLAAAAEPWQAALGQLLLERLAQAKQSGQDLERLRRYLEKKKNDRCR